jgi:glucose/arabinose dehydrogenase
MQARVGCLVGAVAAALLVGVGGCFLTPGTLPPPSNIAPGLQAMFLVSSLNVPAGLAVAADGRVFVAEKNTGQIRVIADDVLLPTPFATVPANFSGEQGLLGIAVHPQFEANGRVYVFYTRSDNGLITDEPAARLDHRVVYFTAGDDPNVATGTETFVLSIPVDGNGNRIGGRLAFAPDGTLLVAVGDLNNQDNAQDLESLAGKLLRLNADGSIPDDNPIADSAVYAFGLRNPQGLVVDPVSETPFVLDRQPTRYHELNRVPARANLGWPLVVGVATTDQEQVFAGNNPDYLDPVLDTGNGSSPLVGLGYNTSTKYGTATAQRLFYGVGQTGAVTSVVLSSDRTVVSSTVAFAEALPRPVRALTFSPQGSLYVAGGNAIVRVENFQP